MVLGLVMKSVAQDSKHAGEVAKLDEARGKGKHQATGDQGEYQHLAPEQFVQRV